MEAWEYPYEVHTLQLSGSVEIAYVDEGEGPKTLLFIHGLGSYLKAWNLNIASLKEQYRCVAIDLPGYGKSSTGHYDFSMSFFAEQVNQFIEKLGLENVVVIGHSMGGQIATQLALTQPSYLDKLVLLAPAGFEKFSEQEKQWFLMVTTPALIRNTTKEQIINNFELNFYEMPENARFMIEDRLTLREDTVAYEAYCEMIPKCVKGMLEGPVFDNLKELSLPVMVVYGENDKLIPNAYLHASLTTQSVAEAGTAEIPKATLHLLPEAGHFVQWDQSEKVNSLISAFLVD